MKIELYGGSLSHDMLAGMHAPVLLYTLKSNSGYASFNQTVNLGEPAEGQARQMQ